MSLGRYALAVVGIVGGTLTLAWPWLPLDQRGRWAAACGGALAALNAVLAYFLVVWSRNRPTRVFLGAVLGGMLGRMAAMLAVIAALILLFELPTLPFTLSLLAYYLVLLGLELTVVHRQTTLAGSTR